MWQEGRERSLLLFNNSSHAINDVQWCPTNSTVFGDVTAGGRLEIWDFELSTVKPVLTHKSGIPLSCLLFSTNSPVVVCGGEDGKVRKHIPHYQSSIVHTLYLSPSLHPPSHMIGSADDSRAPLV